MGIFCRNTQHTQRKVPHQGQVSNTSGKRCDMDDSNSPNKEFTTKNISEMSLLELCHLHEKRNAEIFGPFMKYRNQENIYLLTTATPKVPKNAAVIERGRRGRPFDRPSRCNNVQERVPQGHFSSGHDGLGNNNWGTNVQQQFQKGRPSSEGQGQRRTQSPLGLSDGQLCNCRQCCGYNQMYN